MANASDQDRTGELLVQEVDEDLRREQYVRLWRRYGIYVIAVAVALVVVVFGWDQWRAWKERQRLAEAARYDAAISSIQAGKPKEAGDALAKIASGDNGFAVLAGMRRAELLAQNGDAKGAIAAYDQIAASTAPELLRGLATVKEAMLALAGSDDSTAVEGRLAQLAVAGKPWYFEALELQALFARKKGDDAHAIELLKKLTDDPQAPQNARGIAAEMLAALAPAPVAASAPISGSAPVSGDAKK